MKRLLQSLACVCGFALLAFTTVDAKERPNVLFIAVDDLNDWIGCLGGHPQALTPNMDRLAARGVLFTNSHCAAPACNPSRAAVFSGRMPNVTKVWSNRSGSIDKLYPDAALIPASFSRSGYQTLGTGKLLHSRGTDAFDEYFSVNQRWSPFPKDAVSYSEEELPTKGTDNPSHVVKTDDGQTFVLPLNRMPSDRRPDVVSGESFDWGPLDLPESQWGDTQITDWAIQNVATGFEKPFFMGVGYYRPHIPLWAPEKYFERFNQNPAALPKVKHDDLDDLGEAARNWAIEPITAGSHSTVVKYGQWRSAVEAYLACVTYVDAQIGRLLASLDASEAADNTLIVLWSDHGWHLGEKEHWGKWTGWERSTRVPLIIVPPENRADEFVEGGARCDRPVSLIDLYPTLAEICDVEPLGPLDGQSLVPLLRDPTHEPDRSAITMFDEGNVSLRTDDWRYIRYADGSDELYQHTTDPHEWNNLAGEKKYEGKKRALSEALRERTEVTPSDRHENQGRPFQSLLEAPWREVFFDPCTGDWADHWTLDGSKATIETNADGMTFTAGPVRKENESHAVMWTKPSFEGDVRLDYEYTRTDDTTEAVTILYLQATGSGQSGYAHDIATWKDKRKVASMKTYYNHMNTYHISYAAFDVGNTDPVKDYIRARRYLPIGNRYLPERKQGLSGTALRPDYLETGLFQTGVPHQITVIKSGDDLYMRIRNTEKTQLCHWKTDALPPIERGRIGLRHMWTRGARYRNFRISQLDSGAQ